MIDTHGITTAWLTATLFNAYVDEDPGALSGLRQLLIGGEALSPRHVRLAYDALPTTRIINGYGPTECTTFATCHEIPRDHPADVPVPIGRPIANTRVHLLDGAGGPVAIGVPGELHLGGDGVARGYVSHPELTAERFVPDPFSEGPAARLYRTGDIAVTAR